MGDNRPIGIFDSGIGGLTVAKAIHDLLPNEQLVYFGDTAHFPYGDKSPESIELYSEKISDFLLTQNCKAIVIACNTASSLGGKKVLEVLPSDITLVDVITPVADFFKSTKSEVTGVIATKGTVGSGVYRKSINKVNPKVEVQSLATPLLASMIEEGFFNNTISATVISEYLSHEILKDIDTLILGCTHYPIIETEILNYYKQRSKSIRVLNSAKIVAEEVKRRLISKNMTTDNKGVGNHHFFVSDFTNSFEESTKIFFGDQLRLEKLNLWK